MVEFVGDVLGFEVGVKELGYSGLEIVVYREVLLFWVDEQKEWRVRGEGLKGYGVGV
ncbi:hypothetical protein [Bacillus pumilus]|uniref:hypothetical protein n=1 Tax=Bacillus pumilus TaxID=1408 RepID=UPI0016424846|nr:hypothetical protein [Bacillus pumilus]